MTYTGLAPTRWTETRHHPRGMTCHHFQRYGITCDEYDVMRRHAQYRCEICLTPEVDTTRGQLVIDHYHGDPNRYIRGLLCDRCNSVMSCIDGNKPWGRNRHLEAPALAYAARTHEEPSRERHTRHVGCSCTTTATPSADTGTTTNDDGGEGV